MGMRPPEPLSPEHNIAEFCCQDQVLNEWLKKKALRNHGTGISRVFVVCAENSKRVIAYYCLSSGSVHRNTVTGAYRRNAPEAIPVIVLGRLAVDAAWAGKGIGAALLKDAIYRTEHIAVQVGVRALLVHALNDEVVAFYTKFGFETSAVNALTLLFPVKV
ncbi:GNAT family N-acetyltransferase [Klebsiella variicola]|uniref:GNAT family N-acetyltransferase n=2 Tax=Klebsiella pneumoniae TaxID=573 RepID=UPI000A3CE329|nr:GNAT family N-acetyltransferase [Klebsiella pneumoniae]EIW9027573.1 GNAT family N-acetyltransferase [Klebsiella pneumoniae]EJB4873745.1 GNAT family N-acetyltransferase [Escherichia coli]EMF0765966.1 GNAT family N-acetyltransferase [Klebsiella variicola]